MPKLPPPPRSAQKRSGFSSELAFGRHHFGGDQIVTGKPVFPLQPAHSAAECESPDPGCRDETAGDGKSIFLSHPVKLTPRDAAACAGSSSLRVHLHLFHQREVDNNSIVTERVAGDIMAAASDRPWNVVLPRESDGGHNILSVRALHYQSRMLVYHPVPDRSCLVIVAVSGPQDSASQRCSKLLDYVIVESGGRHSLVLLNAFGGDLHVLLIFPIQGRGQTRGRGGGRIEIGARRVRMKKQNSGKHGGGEGNRTGR